MVDKDILELILQLLVLPATLGVFAAGIVFYYDYIRTARGNTKENLDQQVTGAKGTYEDIMGDMEYLFSIMKYSAWNVAWRKVRPEGIFPEDLIEEDEIKWREYQTALSQWRRKKIQNIISLERYFGKRDSTARLFKLIDASFDKLSYELWFIYHDNPSNPNVFMQYYVEDIEAQYNTIFNAIMTSIGKDITHEQEDNVHKTTSIAFDELQDKINRLGYEMSESIRKGNVGNVRKSKKSKRRHSSKG